MTERWYRCSITFMGSAQDAEECRQKIRMLVDGIPLRDLRVGADPMSEGEVLRALDREAAKQVIEHDVDEGVRLTELMGGPPRIAHPYEEGMWIFPDDHPLAPYERLAAQQKDTEALESLKQLDAQKQLPPGEE